jgi:C-terminal processing protease CtpA/Prc
MNNNLNYGFKRSIVLHTILLALIIASPMCNSGVTGGNPPKDKGDTEEVKKIIEKSVKDGKEPVEVKLIEMPLKSKAKHGNQDCASGQFYGGIGIYQGITEDGRAIVHEAVVGYPGADAGLETGDLILMPDSDAIKGEIGSEVMLTVRKVKTGEVVILSLIRDKICVEPSE